MNISTNDSVLFPSNCSLEARVYTHGYLLFKTLNSTYLRVLIGPGILLNTLCLIVLSRPRLSSKSTTIVFLRFLALFDILAIALKYIRAEINYQSTEKNRDISLLIPSLCKAMYVMMNASISISMWTIVLMSLDKAIAVSYPFKSSIWLTHKRVFYICCCTIVILSTANLSFIKLSGILFARNQRKYCGLTKDSFIVDLLTASILPMGLITAANVVIAVVLHRVSFDWSASESGNGVRDSDPNLLKNHLSTPTIVYRASATSTTTTADIILATKRRTSAQVTRMLLAVTLSLIICNIPNTLFFVFVKLRDTRKLLSGRACFDVTDGEITLYKFGFYSSIFQDILSDLPHIVNFFLYCLAGKKFRSIFVNEVQHFLRELHLLKDKQRRSTQATCQFNSDSPPHVAAGRMHQGRLSANIPMYHGRKSVDALFNGRSSQAVLSDRANYHYHHPHGSPKGARRFPPSPKSSRSYSTIQ